MSGKENQYEPLQIFQKWIQQGGKTQDEFMQNFTAMMKNETFNPFNALKEISEKTAQAQKEMLDKIASFQTQSISRVADMGQMIPNFTNWAAYKTTIGSNGRISIPEAERDALGLGEGSLVQVIILPIDKKSTKEVKQ